MNSNKFSKEQIVEILTQAEEGIKIVDLCKIHKITKAAFHKWRNKYYEASIRVLLFVEDGPSKQKYLDTLAACGVHVSVTSSFLDLSEEICSNTYHGLFIDLPTKMKALKQNKAYVYDLVEKFPVSHLQLDNNNGEVRCYHLNKKSGSTLLDFINNECRFFIPQKIREDVRNKIHLHVLLYKKRDTKKPERSVIENISMGGCFVFSVHRWKVGSMIWLRFKDLTNPKLITAEVRAVVKWGENRMIPGIGLQFKDITNEQADELSSILNL